MRGAARHTPTYPQEGITSNIFTKNIYKKVKTAIRCKRLPLQKKNVPVLLPLFRLIFYICCA